MDPRLPIVVLLGLAGCTPAEPPVTPGDPASTSEVGAVGSLATGDRHTCALDRAGAVWCWGERLRGQLGDRQLGYRPTPAPGPAFVSSDSSQGWSANPFGPSVALAATGSSTCALDRAGQVACWGRMSGGATALLVEGIEGAVELSADQAHACVRLSSGRVQCWDEARSPSTVGGLEDAIELIDGSCARTARGQLRCWSYPDPTVDPLELKAQAKEQARRDRESGSSRVPPVQMARAVTPGESTRSISSRGLAELLQGATSTAGDTREFWLVDEQGRLRELYVVGDRTVEVIGELKRARAVRHDRRNLCWITDEGELATLLPRRRGPGRCGGRPPMRRDPKR